jgi:peptidoglycan/xylan/chitin deacetylase (PgdA/CDA1 family)
MSTMTDQRLVLLYHSISDEARDPFWVRVTSHHFAEQLAALRTVAEIVPLREICESGHGRRVAITFDDGYLDNLEVARPLLERADAPATVFVATDGMYGLDEFWWDRLEHLLLDAIPQQPMLDLDIHGSKLRADMQTREARERALQAIWHRIVVRPMADIEAMLEQIVNQIGAPASCTAHRIMTVDEVRALTDGGLVDIGGHTRSHTMLSALDAAGQWDEIEGCRTELESVLGRPVVTFAYPFGHVDSYGLRTPHLVRKAGFELACTTDKRAVTRWTNRFRIPRFTIPNWDGEEFARRITELFDAEL